MNIINIFGLTKATKSHNRLSAFVRFVLNHKEILIILLLNIIFFAPLIFGNMILLEANLVNLYYPWKAIDELSANKPYNMFCSDGIFYFYQYYKFALEQVKQGILPLWDPYVAAGVPFLGNATFPFFYPGIVLFYILPLNLAWDLTFMLHMLFSGLCMWWFLRYLGLGKESSLLGAVCYNFGGFAFTFLFITEHIYPYFWTPLVFLCFEKYIRNGQLRYIILTGLALGGQILIGQWVFSYYLGLLLSIYALYRIIIIYISSRSFIVLGRVAISYIIILIIAATIAAVAIIPGYDVIQNTGRGVKAINLTSSDYFRAAIDSCKALFGNGSADHKYHPWYFIFSIFSPYILGNYVEIPFWGNMKFISQMDFTSVGARYYGIAPLLLFIVGLFHMPKRKNLYWFFAGMSIVLLLANFMLPNPLYLLPSGNFIMKYHNRLLFLLAFCIPICVAYALEHVFTAVQLNSFIKKFLKFILVFTAGLLMIMVIGYGFKNIIKPFAKQFLPLIIDMDIIGMIAPAELFIRYEMKYLCIASFLAMTSSYIIIKIHSAGLQRRKLYAYLLISIAAIDLIGLGMWFYPRAPLSSIMPRTDSIRFVEKNLNGYRLANYGKYMQQPEVFRPNFPHFYNLRDAGFFNAFPTDGYTGLVSMLISAQLKLDLNSEYFYVNMGNMINTYEKAQSPFLDLMGVKYLLAAEKIRETGTGEISLITNLSTAEVKQPGPNYVFSRSDSIKRELRKTIFQHAGTTIKYHLDIPKNAMLKFGIGMARESWDNDDPHCDGAEFLISINDGGGNRPIFHRELKPKEIVSDRDWHDSVIDLSQYDGRKVVLTLETKQRKYPNADFCLWADPEIVVKGQERREMKLVFDREMKIYENENVMPRAYVVGDFAHVKSISEGIKFINNPSFNPRTIACIESPYDVNFEKSGVRKDSYFRPAKITDDGINSITVKYNSTQPALLVLLDSYYPRWKATLDGSKEAKIYRTNGAFRGVIVPAGKHTVTFHYATTALYGGLLVTGISLCLCMLGLFFKRKVDVEKENSDRINSSLSDNIK